MITDEEGCAFCGREIPDGLQGFCSYACREAWWVDDED